jgi:hypothetical protein
MAATDRRLVTFVVLLLPFMLGVVFLSCRADTNQNRKS